MKLGERRINMMRVFNAREGFTRDDDTLPDRMFEGIESGPRKGEKMDRKEFAEAVELYYEMAGWDKDTGNPKKAKLVELDLKWVWELFQKE
jgi:aldehyde:ferredoxin oxidoreductase